MILSKIHLFKDKIHGASKNKLIFAVNSKKISTQEDINDSRTVTIEPNVNKAT